MCRSDLSLCISNLKRIFKVCIELWISGNPESVKAAGSTLRTLVEECIGQATEPKYHQNIFILFNLVAQCLSYQYKNACPQVLHTMSTFFKVCNVIVYSFVLKIQYFLYVFIRIVVV